MGRLDLPRALRVYWAAEPAALWQALLPVPWELLRAPGASPLFEGREPYLLSLYVGLPALGLALLGAWKGPRPAAIALAALALAAGLVALGDLTPVYGLMADGLGLLRPMRFPAKALVPAGLLLALLAALGLDAWRAALERGSLLVALVPALPLGALPAPSARRCWGLRRGRCCWRGWWRRARPGHAGEPAARAGRRGGWPWPRRSTWPGPTPASTPARRASCWRRRLRWPRSCAAGAAWSSTTTRTPAWRSACWVATRPRACSRVARSAGERAAPSGATRWACCHSSTTASPGWCC